MKYHHLNIFPAEYLRREGTYYVCQYAINELKKSLKFFTDLYNSGRSLTPPQYTIDDVGVDYNLRRVTDSQISDRQKISKQQHNEFGQIMNQFQTKEESIGLTCSICLGSVTISNSSNDQIVITPCCHYFHKSCLFYWIEDTIGNIYKTYPVCRSDSVMNPEQFTIIEIKKASTELENAIKKCFEDKSETK